MTGTGTSAFFPVTISLSRFEFFYNIPVLPLPGYMSEMSRLPANQYPLFRYILHTLCQTLLYFRFILSNHLNTLAPPTGAFLFICSKSWLFSPLLGYFSLLFSPYYIKKT